MKPARVLFIHRSVGRNLIKYGRLYDLLKPYSKALRFADYDHNSGILNEAGSRQKLGYVFPGRNTYPHNLAALFSASSDETKPILDWISQYDVVLLKSCYPTTKIRNDEQLEQMKKDYLQIARYFNKSGQKLGLLTPPPMKPGLTKPEWSRRARAVADWLVSTNLGTNVKVFDLFDLLAIPAGATNANTLRKEYRRLLFFDAHPNRRANVRVAPELAKFVGSFTGH